MTAAGTDNKLLLLVSSVTAVIRRPNIIHTNFTVIIMRIIKYNGQKRSEISNFH